MTKIERVENFDEEQKRLEERLKSKQFADVYEIVITKKGYDLFESNIALCTLRSVSQRKRLS
jgi:hypothetical protein